MFEAPESPVRARAENDENTIVAEPLEDNSVNNGPEFTSSEPNERQQSIECLGEPGSDDLSSSEDGEDEDGWPSSANLTAADLTSTWGRQNTTLNPDFLPKFFENSRLHHLSTWKAELKQVVAKLMQEAHAADQPQKSRDWSLRRVIMHVDFDAFFVAVGLVERPHLADKPVVVCHAQEASVREGGSSDVASANYVARKFGVRNGMLIGEARRRCPGLITIPYEYEKYWAASLELYRILIRHADAIEVVSVDEALIDVSSRVSDVDGSAENLAEAIRTKVKNATRCTVSIGISRNILLARMATRRAKPDGKYHLKDHEVDEFLTDQSLMDLPGVGPCMRQRLESHGLRTIEDVRKVAKCRLQELFGPKNGETLYNVVRGHDHTPLRTNPRQSVSVAVSWGVRFQSNEQVEKFVNDLAYEVSRRLKAIACKAKSLTLLLKVRKPDAPPPTKHLGSGDCNSYTKSKALDSFTDDPSVISRESIHLLKDFKAVPEEIRGLAIQLQKLDNEESKGVSSVTDYFKPSYGETRTYFTGVKDSRHSDDTSTECSDETPIEYTGSPSSSCQKAGYHALQNVTTVTGSEPNRLADDAACSNVQVSQHPRTSEQSSYQQSSNEHSPNELSEDGSAAGCPPTGQSTQDSLTTSPNINACDSDHGEGSSTGTMNLHANILPEDYVTQDLGAETPSDSANDITALGDGAEMTPEERAYWEQALRDRQERRARCKAAWDLIFTSKRRTTTTKLGTKRTTSKSNTVTSCKRRCTKSEEKKVVNSALFPNLDDNGEFDREVFNALPKNLQKSIMAEYRFNQPLEKLRKPYKRSNVRVDRIKNYRAPTAWF